MLVVIRAWGLGYRVAVVDRAVERVAGKKKQKKNTIKDLAVVDRAVEGVAEARRHLGRAAAGVGQLARAQSERRLALGRKPPA